MKHTPLFDLDTDGAIENLWRDGDVDRAVRAATALFEKGGVKGFDEPVVRAAVVQTYGPAYKGFQLVAGQR